MVNQKIEYFAAASWGTHKGWPLKMVCRFWISKSKRQKFPSAYMHVPCEFHHSSFSLDQLCVIWEKMWDDGKSNVLTSRVSMGNDHADWRWNAFMGSRPLLMTSGRSHVSTQVQDSSFAHYVEMIDASCSLNRSFVPACLLGLLSFSPNDTKKNVKICHSGFEKMQNPDKNSLDMMPQAAIADCVEEIAAASL